MSYTAEDIGGALILIKDQTEVLLDVGAIDAACGYCMLSIAYGVCALGRAHCGPGHRSQNR